MTGGAGFVKDSMNTSRNNRRLRDNIKDKHFRVIKKASKFVPPNKPVAKANKLVLDKIILDTKRNNRRVLFKQLIILIISIGIFLAFVLLIRLSA
ncbi:hypothetical protein [Carboxylicivirga linearis]|uniref:Uncharacterized protein n=1 Tax=Carboxylicivirga linearis TaxID=1628157 RepID=A0ABS5JSS3_9BACT|nr:hypothetical protein [Carboxylicivirga linearis]MBS2097953.1 hypothetical protein [Carboxylicivirga linearis]